MSDTKAAVASTAVNKDQNRKPRLLMAVALIAVLTAVVAVALVARSSRSSAKADAQRVREIDHAERQALVAGDAIALDQILAADFVLVPPPGDQESRQEYLDSIASGDLDYQVFEPISAVNVRLSGTIAVVTYRSHLEVTAGGLHVEHLLTQGRSS